MARDHARVNVAIWGSASFRALSPPAQHLYFVLVTSAGLSYCGVADWRPKRLAALAGGWTVQEVESAAAELTRSLTVIIDGDTEEALVRTWIKHDGLINQERMAVSVANAYAGTSSPMLRGVIVHELQKLRKAQPDLRGWSKQKLLDVMDEPAIDPQEAIDLAQTEVRLGPNQSSAEVGLGPNQSSPTPAPAPAPTPAPPEHSSGRGPSASRTSRATQIPDDWQPNDGHIEKAREQGIDLHEEARKFREYCLAHGKTYKNWSMGFHTWLNNVRTFGPRQQPRTFGEQKLDRINALTASYLQEGGDPWTSEPPNALPPNSSASSSATTGETTSTSLPLPHLRQA